MSSIREKADSFEAVKIAWSQDRKGYILKLSLHPNEAIGTHVSQDPLGQRYQVALVRIDDDGQAIASPQKQEANHALRLWMALTRNRNFQLWLVDRGLADVPSFESADAALKEMCGISSKKELATNHQARQEVLGIRNEFDQHVRSDMRLRR